MLQIDGFAFHLYGLFHRNDMHPDAVTALPHERRHMLKRQSRHMLEEQRHLRVLLDHLRVHIEKLTAAGYKHGQYILFLPLRVLPVVLQNAFHGHLLQLRFQLSGRNTRKPHHLRQGLRLTHAHLQRDLSLLVGQHARQTPVLRIISGDLLDSQLLGNPVRDHLTQLYDALPLRLTVIRLMLRIYVLRIFLPVKSSLHIPLLSLPAAASPSTLSSLLPSWRRSE